MSTRMIYFPIQGVRKKRHNSALKIQRHGVVKNALLQTAFSAILPTGSVMHYYCIPCFYKI